MKLSLFGIGAQLKSEGGFCEISSLVARDDQSELADVATPAYAWDYRQVRHRLALGVDQPSLGAVAVGSPAGDRLAVEAMLEEAAVALG